MSKTRRARGHAGIVAAVSLAMLGVMVGACGHDGDARRRFVRDDGAVCLGPPVDVDAAAPQGVDLGADKPLAIGIRSMLLSDMCATKREATCAVKRDGDRLVVKSELSWLGPAELDVRCRGPASVVEARCATEPLPAGTYHVVVGAQTVDVTLPSHLDKSCAGLPDEPRPAFVPTVTAPLVDAAAPPVASGTAVTLDPSTVPSVPGTGVVAEAPPGDTMCIAPLVPTKNRALRAGQPVAITILHKNACVGATCTSAAPKCKTKRKGAQITLDVTFPSPTTKPSHPCSEECTALAVTCRTDALPAGTYTLDLGTQHKTLQIPADSAPPCGL